jgi:hypothetical protein
MVLQSCAESLFLFCAIHLVTVLAVASVSVRLIVVAFRGYLPQLIVWRGYVRW